MDNNQFEPYRPLLFSIAYRMMGSATDAEDMVQEAYLRYQRVSPEQIVSHKALLTTIVTRLCLNHLELAQTRRKSYPGPWLPEPILIESDDLADPPHQTELRESLSIAFLRLLEQLTPPERAVFLLRAVFDYEYAEIAEIIGKTEATCRQMFSRARKHISAHRPRFTATPEAHHQLFMQFLEAASSGDLQGLLRLLAEDVTMWADGGGKVVGSLLYPLHGREAVARFLLASPRLAPENACIAIKPVNGESALIILDDSTVFLVLTITIDAGYVSEVCAIGNPDKLRSLGVRGGTDNKAEGAAH